MLARRCTRLGNRPWSNILLRRGYTTIPVLASGDLDSFRSAFQSSRPVLLPRGHFNNLPAVQKWFCGQALDQDYLSTYGDALVPLEIIQDGAFTQVMQPLAFFIQASSLEQTATSPRIYLAQASLADLPPDLRQDVPTPDLVLKAGKGDVYDTSIWLGRAPTYTPLHRDPNPNLFVQLAGRKRVRMFGPAVGDAIFGHVQRSIGARASASMRGAEMMEGKERTALEQAVWDDDGSQWAEHGWQCEMSAGDGLFIPLKWWHSIKGIGQGMTGSVNWWFR